MTWLLAYVCVVGLARAWWNGHRRRRDEVRLIRRALENVLEHG